MVPEADGGGNGEGLMDLKPKMPKGRGTDILNRTELELQCQSGSEGRAAPNQMAPTTRFPSNALATHVWYRDA